ncbi:hypothetical protein P3S67_002108 [Capsicum chacoense]
MLLQVTTTPITKESNAFKWEGNIVLRRSRTEILVKRIHSPAPFANTQIRASSRQNGTRRRNGDIDRLKLLHGSSF